MKGLKDFFHNSNDMILAILIIAIAIGLIVWRLNIILDYPEKAAAQASAKTNTTQSADTDNTDNADNTEKAAS